METEKEREARSQRERKQRRFDAGLCWRCGKTPFLPNRKLCQNCTDKRDAENRIQRARRKINNLCHCGRKTESGKTKCKSCLERENEQQRRRSVKRKAANLCYTCGKHPARNHSQYCEICTLKEAAKNNLGSRKRYEKLKVLFLKQKQHCPYTGDLLKLGTNTSLDHKVPKAKGGTDDIENLQWVCKWANYAKQDFSEEEFLGFVKRCYEHLNLGQS